MNDEKKTEKKPEQPAPEEVLRQRINASVTGELSRLEVFAAKCMTEGNNQGYAAAVESMAGIKMRCEVYCIQVEMAAKTAALASAVGGMMRQGPSPAGVGGPGQPQGRDLADLLEKAKGGRGKPPEDGGEPPKDDQNCDE